MLSERDQEIASLRDQMAGSCCTKEGREGSSSQVSRQDSQTQTPDLSELRTQLHLQIESDCKRLALEK